ncbi:MAG: Protein of unknown function (DUF1553)/Protein of unknown function (DUF1549) [Verrucomicrobia bacterium]|nr:MAG: Protein of unknown function (DUF1553)/Protein of unknown function (DUF1549) [Verrucomicrobiota bacterium]
MTASPEIIRCLVLLCAFALSPVAGADVLRIFPEKIDIHPHAASQRVVVTLTDARGVSSDVTSEASVTLEDTRLARWQDGVLNASASGQTRLLVEHAGLSARAGVKVNGSAEAAWPSFQNEVVPVLMRYGCSSGGCHGATRGKDGFRLSLFGYDPDADHFRLTREFVNRRVNVALPQESLLLKKSAGTVPHGGGKKLTPTDPNFDLLREWIAAGAPRSPADEAHMSSVCVYPADLTLDAEGQNHRVVVMGSFTDGSQRDVTHLSILESSDDSIVSVTREGILSSHRRGEVFVSVRLPSFISGVRVDVVPGQQAPAPLAQSWNFIDEPVYARLSKLRMTPAEVCSDDDFVRRVFIDAIGLLPSLAETQEFRNDTRSDKRAQLVDRLLARPEFTDLWTMKWGERLQARSIVSASASHQKATVRYTEWLHRQIESETPMNEVIHRLVAAKGTWIENPESNFYRERDPKVLMENMAQLFLGARIQCAQCHNHPFDRWTQNDYYGMVAFFARTQKKSCEDMMDVLVYEAPSGETSHPVTQKLVVPKFLGGEHATTAGRERRKVLADWLTAPDNRLVARNLANIYWQHFFGVGIIDPVDDARVSNPPSNPELLEALAARLVEVGFKPRALIRDILLSRTYQHSSVENETNRADTRNFSHSYPRRMLAEVLWDCLTQATGYYNDGFYFERPGTRAVQIGDGGITTTFLSTFGRSKRETPCTCEVKSQPTLSQALSLINGSNITNCIERGKNLPAWTATSGDPQEVIRKLYLTSLSRLPSDFETAAFAETLRTRPAGPSVALQDIFWAVLNSNEFLFNH